MTVSNQVAVDLWPGQLRLITDKDRFTHVLSAGVGYGKTHVGARWCHTRACLNKSAAKSFVCAPTNKLLKHVNLEYYKNYLNQVGYREGVHYSTNLQDMFLEYYFGHRVFFISAETWKNVVGWEFSHGWIDEPGWLQEEVFHYLVERVRAQAPVNQMLFTGVSQGATPYYDKFSAPAYTEEGRYKIREEKQLLEFTRYKVTDSILLMHASSMENPRLPKTYYQQLRDAYGWNHNLWLAHVHGFMIAMSSRTFYFEYNAAKHDGDYQPRLDIPRLYLCLDNNVGSGTWVVIQEYDHPKTGKQCYFVVADNGGTGRNLPDMCDQFARMFPPEKWKNHELIILGDAALHARSPQTYTTGYQLVEQTLRPLYPRLRVDASRGNPFVRERSECTNRLFATGKLYLNYRCATVKKSFASAEADGKGGIKKPSGDQITHAAEAADMGLIVLSPNLKMSGGGINW